MGAAPFGWEGRDGPTKNSLALMEDRARSNEVVHSKPPPPVEASCRFLCSHIESIATIKYYPQADNIKGKMPCPSACAKIPTQGGERRGEEKMAGFRL
jgi:hypothetical protein